MAKICVPICVSKIDEVRDAMDTATAVADIIELRADCFPLTDSSVLMQTISNLSKPWILTLRSPEQDGRSANDFAARRRFWMSSADLPAESLVDLELDMVDEFWRGESAGQLPINWQNVICSHHDFRGVPPDLGQIYESMAATPAGVLKIAVTARDATDCLPAFELLARAEKENRKIIAIAIGQPGLMTRILGPARGSFLTYAPVTEDVGTAPGQITVAELRDMYRINRINPATEIFGILGQPVSHSLSPHIHNAAFAAKGLDAVYLPFEASDACAFIRRMVHPKTRELDWELRGLSITAPHKSIIMQELDWIDPAGLEIGAVNTIVVKGQELHGYNTDAAGFISPLRNALGSARGARCAVVGTGGAARACIWGLKHEAAEVTVVAREAAKAAFLATAFDVRSAKFPLTSFADFDVVINTTPLGTHGDHEDDSIATAEQLRGVRLAYDLVYNPRETKFLRAARTAGCEALSGIEMLLAQAVEQFKLWTGTQPDSDVMRSAAWGRLPD